MGSPILGFRFRVDFGIAGYNCGNVSGDVTRMVMGCNFGTVTGNASLCCATNSGTIGGNGIFCEQSQNCGNISGCATFFCSCNFIDMSGCATFSNFSINFGTIGGFTSFCDYSTNYATICSGVFKNNSYNDLKEMHTNWIISNSGAQVLYYKQYRNGGKFLGCGDFTVDTKDAMDKLLDKETLKNFSFDTTQPSDPEKKLPNLLSVPNA
jgi:hypothetical protein